MQRRRFYGPPETMNNARVMLSNDETHHLTRVLRLKPGDDAYVFDGCGREYRCRFLKIESDRAQLEVLDELLDAVEPPISLTLGQSIAKGEKFDFIVQKATELGVGTIIPLITDHADVKLADERSAKRLERWRRISLEALKQCGRRTIVDIRTPMIVEELLGSEAPRLIGEQAEGRAVVVFAEKGGAPVNNLLAEANGPSAVTVLIGPEGGWSIDELSLFAERGVKSVTLGPRTLRTETAAIVAMTLIQHALGDVSREFRAKV
ncbi:MAG TPA: 16S rRNA (uracil(1498)-N(3))-methyltransferase [Blastocatellia bacterium]|nr:16S rRNA (uracil(1498)-N(3))-methyltransferase [Blastocatellia bacterium]